MYPFSQIECPKCHAKNKSGARYCGECGGRLPGSMVKCNNCGAEVPADKKHCSQCGKPLAESESPLLTGNRWARRVEDFATKVEVSDVEGFFKRGLIVEAGTKAIFFVNGAVSGILDPGKYDMGGLIQKIANVFNSKTTTAVLTDTGDVELRFSLADLVTRDPIKLSTECRLVAQMDNPTLFFENMMKGHQNYSLRDLNGFLEGELRNCLQEFIGSRSVQELSTNLAFKQQMEEGVAQHLATTFDRKGLAFRQVRIFDFRHPRMNALTNKMEEYWLHKQELETRLGAEPAIAGLERKLMDQDTAKALMEVEVYEERAQVYGRMRKAVASEQMDNVRSEDDLEKLLQGVDKDKFLRREEIEALKRDFAEKKEDHDLARRHLIQRLKIEQDTELQRTELVGKINLNRTLTDAQRAEEMARKEHELSVKRKEIETRQAEEWAAVKHQAEARRLQVETEIDLAKKKKLTEIDLEELEDQADMRTAMGALDILKKQKAIKQEEMDRETTRQMQVEAQRHQQRIAEIQTLAGLSGEALIAASPSDRAAMLADLKRTETLKGYTEEQILAMSAKESPEIARAFQEKYKGASSVEIQKAYERMLEMKDQGTKDLKEMSRDYANRMQEMFNRGMDTQRDTATAAARASQPGTTVITPGMGAAGVVQTGPGGAVVGARMVVCPECHSEVAEGNKYCDNCGHKFFG